VPAAPAAPATQVVEWRPPDRPDPQPPAAGPRGRPVALIGVGAAALIAIVVAAIVVLTRSGDDADTAATTTTPAAATDPPTGNADTSTSTGDGAAPGEPVVVATLDAAPLTMSGSATGAMIVSTDAGEVLSITDDGTARSVAVVPDDI